MSGLFDRNEHLTIITGHYGVGKTNLALNLVRDLRERYPKVILIDLDIVNPYFRASDSIHYLQSIDVDILGPVFANSNLDTPSLSPGIDTALAMAGMDTAVVVDVGGDPDGARALARFSPTIKEHGYRLLYVINKHRLQIQITEEAFDLLHEIELTSKLMASGVVANTHLKYETTPEMIFAAIPYAISIAQDGGLSLAAITVPRDLSGAIRTGIVEMVDSHQYPIKEIEIYPIDILVRTPWE